MNDEIKKKIEEIFGELIDLEQHSFTTGSVTQLYVKWDDLLTAQFDVEKKLSALYTEMVEGELRGFVEYCRALADLYEKEHYKKNPQWYGGNINALRNIANYMENGELNGDAMPKVKQYLLERKKE